MIRRLTPRAAVALVAWAALAAAAGCGGDKAKTAVVRGKVTYKGAAVPNGTVTFMPDPSGPPATGEIQPDGTFTLTTYAKGDGAVLGKHKVIVVAMQDQGARLPEEKTPLPPPIVPVRYTSPATTPLTATVEDKENAIVLDLKDKD